MEHTTAYIEIFDQLVRILFMALKIKGVYDIFFYEKKGRTEISVQIFDFTSLPLLQGKYLEQYYENVNHKTSFTSFAISY